MKFIRPKEYALVIEPVADYVSTLAALSFAALRTEPTTITNVERTELLAAFEPFLNSGGIELTWDGNSVTAVPRTSMPFTYLTKLPDYELFRYALTLAATRAGSRLAVIDDFDETLQNLVLAFRRMGAELEFTGGKEPQVVVRHALAKEVKYYLKRESAKLVPQLVLAMTAQGGHSEINDLFESSRLDYLFEQFVSEFARADLTTVEAADELERRLQKRAPRVLEFRSRVTIAGGVRTGAAQISLRPDAEFAAYLAAAVVNHGRGRLILRSVRADDITATPLSQLKRMGVEVASERGPEGPSLVVTRSQVKSRSVHYDQMHEFPDAIGAIALANARADGTAVIRSSPFNTDREEARRRSVSNLIRAFGVKVAEISDGVVLEGRSEIGADNVTTGDDPVCALMAAAAALGTVSAIEVDRVDAARARWGTNFQKLLDLLSGA